jgi:hypothetical protein
VLAHDELTVDLAAPFERADQEFAQIGRAWDAREQADPEDRGAGERARGRIAASTIRRVSGRTLFSPLMTRDTVIRDTPAWTATSWMVGAPRRRVGGDLVKRVSGSASRCPFGRACQAGRAPSRPAVRFSRSRRISRSGLCPGAQTTPNASIASATFLKPAMFAPFT